MEDDKVVGILATKKDGSTIQSNAKAVILGSGGFAGNQQMMEERGWRKAVHMGFPGHNGDGLRMALTAGAADDSIISGGLAMAGFTGLSGSGDPVGNLNQASVLWENETGERFVREDCGAVHMGVIINALRVQNMVWNIVDSGIVASTAAKSEGLAEKLDAFVTKNPDKNVYKADSIEALAQSAGLDPIKLAATVTRYNTVCAQGKDEDWGKDSASLVALTTAPYYVIRLDPSFATTICAVRVNRGYQAIKPSGLPITGLYAIGCDGCEILREAYTIDRPGSANDNNVNSGRTAAKNAVASL